MIVASALIASGCAGIVVPEWTDTVTGPHAVELALGYTHSCARISDGTVRCWGDNRAGQLGDGSTTDRSAAVAVEGLTDAVSIAAGLSHSCAIVADGTVRCWGWLGSATPSPTRVEGVANARQLALGNSFSCALLDDGRVTCWGANFYGAIGNGRVDDSDVRVPPTVVAGLPPAADVAAGEGHVCARTVDGAVWCWGRNTSGEVGRGRTSDQESRAGAVAGVTDATAIVVGQWKTCAVTRAGRVFCWGGWDGPDQPISSTANAIASPAEFPVLTGLQSFSIALWADCGIEADHSIACWGSGGFGFEWHGERSRPTPIAGLANMRAVSVRNAHACALGRMGNIWCWGQNDHGEIGDGTTTGRDAPTPVLGF